MTRTASRQSQLAHGQRSPLKAVGIKRTERALGGDEALMVAVQRAYCLAEAQDLGGACKMLTEIWHATTSLLVRYRVRTVIERFKLPTWLMS